MKYRLLPSAENDLRHIDDWVASNFGEAAALKVQQGLLEKFDLIAESQGIGIPRPDVRSGPIRFLASWPNWIAYEPGSPVIIHRILSVRMDISRLRL